MTFASCGDNRVIFEFLRSFIYFLMMNVAKIASDRIVSPADLSKDNVFMKKVNYFVRSDKLLEFFHS